MIAIKYTANVITMGRILGSFLLLLFKPLSVPFFLIYALCGVSDILDGYIARKTKTVSKLGEALDSVADLIFIGIMLFICIPLFAWARWMIYWISIVAIIRLLTFGTGFVKYHTMPFLHTYANKITGIILFCILFLYRAFGLTAAICISCGFASISALEELAITIRSKKLDRNAASIFSKN